MIDFIAVAYILVLGDLFHFCSITIKVGQFDVCPTACGYEKFILLPTMTEVYTYQELRELALKHGIRDKKVHIGVWIQTQGYQKQRIQINHIRKTFYLKSHD